MPTPAPPLLVALGDLINSISFSRAHQRINSSQLVLDQLKVGGQIAILVQHSFSNPGEYHVCDTFDDLSHIKQERAVAERVVILLRQIDHRLGVG